MKNDTITLFNKAFNENQLLDKLENIRSEVAKGSFYNSEFRKSGTFFDYVLAGSEKLSANNALLDNFKEALKK